MKKIIFAGLFLMSSLAYAETVWRSSFTASSDTAQNLCNSGRHGTLHSICVGTASSGTITVLDSRGGSVANSTFTVMSSTAGMTGGCRVFDVVASSGINYTSSGASVTFLYNCY